MTRRFSHRLGCYMMLTAGLVVLAVGITLPAQASAATRASPQLPVVISAPMDSGTHCNQDACMAVDSLGGKGPDITYVAVWMRDHSDSEHQTGNEQVRWYTQRGYNNAPRSLKGARSGPWTEDDNMWPYGAYWNPYLYVTPGYWICGMITGIGGYPCITVGS